MPHDPTIRQLRHFLSLSEYRHFGHAADACFITQSSLSASIKELENLLGGALFERSRRSVLVTAFGEKIIPLAKEILDRVDILTDAAKSANAPLSGDLRVGVIPTIGPFLLPRVLPDLIKNYPDLNLLLREEQTAPLLRQLADGKLDLVLIALPYETENVESFVFAEDPFLAVFPRGHTLSRFETMTPKRMAEEPLLMLSEGNCLNEQTLAMKNFGAVSQLGHFQATSLHTLVQMVANGFGLCVLPKMAVDAGILRGLKTDFRPFSSPNARRKIALVWRSTSQRGVEFRILGRYLRDELATPLAAS